MTWDYSNLEEREVTYTHKGRKIPIKVGLIDYHIGITLVNKDSGKPHICLLSRASSIRKGFKTDECCSKLAYRKTFFYLVKQIKKGELGEELRLFYQRVSGLTGTAVNENSCPFK